MIIIQIYAPSRPHTVFPVNAVFCVYNMTRYTGPLTGQPKVPGALSLTALQSAMSLSIGPSAHAL
jgi:hypothetical protein